MVNEIVKNLKKDLAVEFRSRVAFTISLAFAAISTLAVSLISGGTPFSHLVLSILLWLVLFFSAMNGLAHIFVREEEEQTSLFLRLHVSAEAVFISKVLFNVMFFIVLECIVVPLFLFFLQAVPVYVIHFVLTVLAGGIAMACGTTILGAMVARAGGKGSLFTILSFPVLLPALWISISETALSLQKEMAPSSGNLVFLLAFSGLVVAISFLLFRFVWFSE